MSKEELDRHDNIALTGEDFRRAVGGYTRAWDEEKNCMAVKFNDPRKFDEIKKKIRIIARCTPEDKFILVAGIRQKGGLVGMAGDSIADAESLKNANVGMCMGSGCDVAKDNSDLVILDNDFFSIQRAIRWGRSIFENVRKFMVFQMTVNISLLTVTFLGGATLGHLPLNVIQMLWVNLIMDILAAIALGTEPYDKNEVADK